jgi:hypothetical protein
MPRDPNDGAVTDPAARLLDRLRSLVAQLDSDERALLAALLAPGVALAYEDDSEVAGFDGSPTTGDVGWSPDRLPAHLRAAVRRRDLRIVGD